MARRGNTIVARCTVLSLIVILIFNVLKQSIRQLSWPSIPTSKFKSLNDVIDQDSCFFYNQIRPINIGSFPEFENATPTEFIHSKHLFHGRIYGMNDISEWKYHYSSQINEFPQFLFSGRQVVGSQWKERALVYQHWSTLGLIPNQPNFIDIDDLHMCKNILSFFPLEKYDSNIAQTHKFFKKTYLPNYGVPLVEYTTSYPMMLKCAELDGADEGVYLVENGNDFVRLKKNVTCLNWIQQKYIPPNPFSTADVNLYIHKNKSFSFIGVSPEIYREVGSINSITHDLYWLSQFEEMIKIIASHIILVSNYSGFVCFDAVRDQNGEWRVVDINVRLCGGDHHFMIANRMIEQNFMFWQYFDHLPAKKGLTCEELIEIIDHVNKQKCCKNLITSFISENDRCVLNFMLFGTSMTGLSQCFPIRVFDWTGFDPWHIKIESDDQIMNKMMPTYLLDDF